VRRASSGRCGTGCTPPDSRKAVLTLFTSRGRDATMVDALVARIPQRRRLNAGVERCGGSREMAGDQLWAHGGIRRDDLATPAYAAAELLAARARSLRRVERICYSSSVTVILGFDKSVRAALPAGLVLFADGEAADSRGTFAHNKFSGRALRIGR